MLLATGWSLGTGKRQLVAKIRAGEKSILEGV